MKAGIAIWAGVVFAVVLFARNGRAQCIYTSITGCHISTAAVEVNLGPVPFDHYNDLNAGYLPDSNSTYGNCSFYATVRWCIQNYVAGYVAEGASGVRFQFGLGGGGYSTPFDASGNLRSTWESNLAEFFSDLYAAGIRNITPTPALQYFPGDGASDQGSNTPSISSQVVSQCNISGVVNTNGTTVSYVSGSGFSTYDLMRSFDGELITAMVINGVAYDVQSFNSDGTLTLTSSAGNQSNVGWGAVEYLTWVPWLPYGLTPVGLNYWADCVDDNNAYSDAARNDSTANSNSATQFWGWTPFNSLVLAIAYAAANTGLSIEEFDIQNELDLLNFLSTLRLAFDWDFTTNAWAGFPLSATQEILDYFDPGAGGHATFSTGTTMPTLDGFDCGSVYGDSAMIFDQSELQAGINGGLIGIPTDIVTMNGLGCEGSDSPMYAAPNLSLAQPTINDFHESVCITNPEGTDPNDTSENPTVIQRCYAPDLGDIIPGETEPIPSDYGSATARNFYNDVWNFFAYREITSNKAMIGETNWMQNENATIGGTGESVPVDCWWGNTADTNPSAAVLQWNGPWGPGFPFDNTMAYSNVNGFNGYNDGTNTSSLLYQNALSQTVLRIWENEMGPLLRNARGEPSNIPRSVRLSVWKRRTVHSVT